ncbi:MAG: L,D-transpeptidase, partial [Myxococcota bacterium]|nr:L,D-transpeptidase [Myxococcota bacterium]
PSGRIPGWVHGYEGGIMRAAPEPDAAVGAELAYHQFLVLDAVPADPEGRWWRVPDGLGDGVDGFVSDEEGVRRWSTAPLPTGLLPTEVWVDVDVRQQMLTVYEGTVPVYVTMVSTGKRGHSTPLGTFRIYDKMVTVDMVSREDAAEDDRYHVEAVPWSMHFWPRYALHGAYWHWGFGNRASHGCVNMSPRDARWIFDRLHPVLPDGWHTVFESTDDPGSILRIRYEQELGRERRKEPGERWRSR